MPSESLDCCSNAARMIGMTSNAVGIFRLLLECSSNYSNAVGIIRAARMQLDWLECTSNAVGIFRLLLECSSNDWNALRMPSESLDCCSNAARMILRKSTSKWLECTSNAVGIFRLLLECSSNDWNALRMPSESLDCCSNAARMILKKCRPIGMHFECRRNL